MNHSTEINAKYHLTDKLLEYDLIQGRDILHDSGIIFNFKIKPSLGKKVSIPIKLPNCTAKEYFVIKESCRIRNATKRIKQEQNKFEMQNIRKLT